MSQTQAPPAPTSAPAERQAAQTDDSVYVTSGPAAQPIDWAALSPAAASALEDLAADQKAERKAARRRGVPVGPAMATAANGTAMALTGAYQVGGIPGIAGAGALTLAGAAASIARRRAAVRRQTAQRSLTGSGSRTGAGWSGSRSGGGGVGAWSSGNRSTGLSGLGGTTPGRGTRKDIWSLPRPSGARTTNPAAGSAGHKTPGAGSGRGVSQAGAGHRPGRAPGSAARNVPGHARGSGRSALTGPLARYAANRIADAKNDWKEQASKRRQLAASAGRHSKNAAATGWAKTKPAQAKAWAAAKWTAGAAWDGTAAVTRGVATAIWQWNLRSGWQRLREVWARRRQRRADKAAGILAQADAATAPDIAETVRRPAHTPHTHTSSTTNGGTMSGHHFTASAMEMARAAAAYEPTAMLQVGEDFANLPEALRLVAEAMKITTEKADGSQPLDPRIIEVLRGIYQLQMKAAEMADELSTAFENLHHVDLNRLRNPRNGEEMWDVTTNRA